jgi:alcohol dehydrogenase
VTSSFGLLRPPGTVLFGAGMADGVGDLARRHGEHVVLCTDAYLAGADQGQRVLRSLRDAGLRVTVLDAAEPELPLGSVERALAEVRSSAPDVVVGLGGGSSLDFAKLIALGLSDDRPYQDFYGESDLMGPLPPLLALPTTAGTGSEVTPVAVISDPERTLKVGISNPRLTPVAAICDPLLSHGAPAHVTAHAGIDALAHAIEAYCAIQRTGWDEIAGKVFVGRNRFSDLFALEAITLLAGSLERAVDDDPDARADALLGSLYAGLAFATAGTALAHALQYPIGARTKTPHGLGVGVMLPYVMRFNAPACEDRLIDVATALGVEPTVDAAIDRVAEIAAALGLPASVAEIGLDAADLEGVVEQALGIGRLVSNNPREVTLANLTELVATAFEPTPDAQEAR